MTTDDAGLLVDTSAIMAVLNNESSRDAVVGITRDRDVFGAESLPFEIANALCSALKQLKQKRFDETQAVEAFRLFETMPIGLVPVPFVDSLRIAAKYRLYGYDAGVLAVARTFGYELLTFDRGMRHVALAERIPLVEV